MSKRANGEGTIYQRRDGRWTASCYVTKPGVGRVRRYVYGATREEVHAKWVTLVGQVHQGVPVAPAALTVAAYLTSWLTDTAARRVRPSTYAGYEINVRVHINPRIGKRRLGRLSTQDLRTLLTKLEESGMAARSVQYVHATLRAALEDAVREELLPRNVAKLVRAPRPVTEEREPLTPDQARALIKSTRDDRLHALFVVLVLLGLRRGEALGLRWRDIDLDARVLRVRQTLQRVEHRLQYLPPKTRRSKRTVPLPAACVTALCHHAERQDAERASALDLWPVSDLVFTTPIGTAIEPRNFTRMFQAQCEAAGVPVVRLHDLRHTCVSLLLSLGVSPRVVMEIAGHTALEMTMNVYGHVDMDDRREALDRLNELLEW